MINVIVTARLGPREARDPRHGQLVELRDLVAFVKERGCLHHQLLDLDGDWWLIEEWESPERFEAFFDRTPEFRRALCDAGFREFPDNLRLWRPIESKEELDYVPLAATGTGNGATR
jgi:quinol monooxygenase YgiN